MGQWVIEQGTVSIHHPPFSFPASLWVVHHMCWDFSALGAAGLERGKFVFSLHCRRRRPPAWGEWGVFCCLSGASGLEHRKFAHVGIKENGWDSWGGGGEKSNGVMGELVLNG